MGTLGSLCAAALCAGVCSMAFAPCSHAQVEEAKVPIGDPYAGIVADAVLDGGYRRVLRTERLPATPERLAELAAAGKAINFDPATGSLLIETFTDYLPPGWLHSPPEGLPPGVKVDSYGDVIVNSTPGLPDWSQKDVDGLRSAIAEHRHALAKAPEDQRVEREWILGNFIGQAIIRGIAFEDLAPLGNAAVVTPGVAQAVLGLLNYYENLRLANQDLFGYEYEPSVYPQAIHAFAAANGWSMSQVLAVQPPAGLAGLRGTDCYNRASFVPGMIILTTPTVIWEANGLDDGQADVPIGFATAHLYGCSTSVPNSQVRVSTNGYISFFQQGGGALIGTDFSNDPIPDTTDPDGFAAPFWDDLWIAPSQGTADAVRYRTEGAVGSRVFTVEYFSVSHLNAETNEFFFFQVKIFETTDVIEFHFATGGNWSNGTGVISYSQGIEDFDGSIGECGVSCLNTNSAQPSFNYRFTPIRPFNIACGSTFLIRNGETITGDLTSALDDGDPTCGSSSTNRALWYRFTASCAGMLAVSTCGTHDAPGVDLGMDTVVALFASCGGAQLACNDDSTQCTGQSGLIRDSYVTTVMAAGQTVYIRVSHFFDTLRDGNFTVTANFTPSGAAPANDDCVAATRITGFSGTTTGNLSCATNDAGVNGCHSTFNNDVWFTYTAPCNGSLRVTTCGTNDGPGVDLGMDTLISMLAGCGGAALACNDDGAVCTPVQQGSFYDSSITRALTAGETVVIAISHFGSSIADGNYRFTWEFTAAGPPANDNCASAQLLVGNVGSLQASLLCATNDGATTCGASSTNRDAWYRFVAPSAGTFRVTTCGTHDAFGLNTGMDTVLSAHSACPGTSLNTIACNDDIGPIPCAQDTGIFRDSSLQFGMSNGQAVWVRVSHFGSGVADGAFQLNHQFIPTCSADYNNSGAVTVQDIYDFLADWNTAIGGGTPIGNPDFNGLGGVTVQDIYDFLAAWNAAIANPPCGP